MGYGLNSLGLRRVVLGASFAKSSCQSMTDVYLFFIVSAEVASLSVLKSYFGLPYIKPFHGSDMNNAIHVN
jgi:hypothetical protein